MNSASLSCEGVVLGRDTGGERHMRLLVFSKSEGPLKLLYRLRTSGKPGPRPPDLFDFISVEIDRASNGHSLFIRECKTESPFTRIGSHYQTLVEASSFALTIWKNLTHAEYFEELYSLCLRSLEAFARNERPEVTHFKSLYLLARTEGYPVKEQMLASWTRLDQGLAHQLLSEPVNGNQPHADEVRRLLGSLQSYLKRSTDILI